MEPNQGIKAWQWIVTVIVIVILVVLGYYLFKGPSTTSYGQTPVVENPTSSTDVNALLVSDQYPGNIVYITSVELANPGWVVIQSDNNGTPGNIIGSTYFTAGTNSGKVTLASKTVEGGLYYATLYNDDGNQKFDATKDLPLKDSTGAIIMKSFHATVNISGVKG